MIGILLFFTIRAIAVLIFYATAACIVMILVSIFLFTQLVLWIARKPLRPWPQHTRVPPAVRRSQSFYSDRR